MSILVRTGDMLKSSGRFTIVWYSEMIADRPKLKYA